MNKTNSSRSTDQGMGKASDAKLKVFNGSYSQADSKSIKVKHSVSPLKTGVTLVTGVYGAAPPFVFAVMVRALARQSNELPVPMPACSKVLHIHSGPARQLEQVKGMCQQLELTGQNIEMQTIECDSSLDWTNPGTCDTLKRIIQENKCAAIVVQQPVGSVLRINELISIRQSAEKSHSWVVILQPCESELKSASTAIFNDYLVVSDCDPNPGFDHAFVITCPDLCSPINPSSGRVVCMVRLKESGLKASFMPFISDDRDIRLMAILKGMGWTGEKIGNTFNINKSNVSRKLHGIKTDGLPKLSDEMLIKWFDACGLKVTNTKSGKAPANDENEDEDWDFDDDSDDTEVDEDEDEDGDDIDLDKLDHSVRVIVADRSRNKRNERNERNTGIAPKRKFR